MYSFISIGFVAGCFASQFANKNFSCWKEDMSHGLMSLGLPCCQRRMVWDMQQCTQKKHTRKTLQSSIRCFLTPRKTSQARLRLRRRCPWCPWVLEKNEGKNLIEAKPSPAIYLVVQGVCVFFLGEPASDRFAMRIFRE